MLLMSSRYSRFWRAISFYYLSFSQHVLIIVLNLWVFILFIFILFIFIYLIFNTSRRSEDNLKILVYDSPQDERNKHSNPFFAFLRISLTKWYPSWKCVQSVTMISFIQKQFYSFVMILLNVSRDQIELRGVSWKFQSW